MSRRRSAAAAAAAAAAAFASASASAPRRGLAAAAASVSAAAPPDYYRALGVARDASLDEIKAAFREKAKQHHPDTRASSASAAAAAASGGDDLALFKLVNEAYSVLASTPTRREYDANAGIGGGPLDRTAALRARNEGVYGGAMVERPSSSYAAGPEWQTLRGPGASAAAAGSALAEPPPAGAAYSAADNMEAFRASMSRAAEKQREGARYRASLARLNRARIDVPHQDSSGWRVFAAPAAIAALWLGNWFFFMR